MKTSQYNFLKKMILIPVFIIVGMSLYLVLVKREELPMPQTPPVFATTTASVSTSTTQIDDQEFAGTVYPATVYQESKTGVYKNVALGFKVTLPDNTWFVPNELNSDPHFYSKLSCADSFKEGCVGAEIQGQDEKYLTAVEAIRSLEEQYLEPVRILDQNPKAVFIKSKVPPPFGGWTFAYHIFYPGTEHRFLILTNSETVEENIVKSFELSLDPKRLTDDAYRSALGDSSLALRMQARGDVNNDGYEDAIVEETNCGASCSVSLQLVLNDKKGNAILVKDSNYPDTFAPAYVSSSAVKSEVDSISIKNGRIYLTGKGLACSNGPEDVCTPEKWNTIKTATYIFDGMNIVQYSIK